MNNHTAAPILVLSQEEGSWTFKFVKYNMEYTSIFSLKMINRTPKGTTETVRDLTFLLEKQKQKNPPQQQHKWNPNPFFITLYKTYPRCVWRLLYLEEKTSAWAMENNTISYILFSFLERVEIKKNSNPYSSYFSL